MNYYTHTNNERTFIFVELPKDAYNLTVSSNLFYGTHEPYSALISYPLCGKLPISKDYKLLSEDITAMSESEVSEVIEHSDRHDGLFIDYREESTRYVYLLKTSLESLKSLTESLGMDSDKRYCLLELLNVKE